MLRCTEMLILLLTAVLVLTTTTNGDDRTNENTPKLADFFKKFPAADLDKDGILKWDESVAFLDAQRRTAKANQLQPKIADVSYGKHPRNVLDFFRAKSETPTRVLIFFHGGGFVGGDKARARSLPVAQDCLANGISVISANYRFVRGKNSEPFPGSLMDGVHAVQFVRTKAKEWNIDPDRIVLSGGSAGALMSIWIAVHDDFGNPNSESPVARQSTRVLGVISYGGQTTIDPRVIVKHIGGDPNIHPSIFPIYGIKSIDELNEPEMRDKVAEFSALTHVTKDDPPLQLHYGGKLTGTPLPPETNVGVSIHHAMFGDLIRRKYQEVGVKAKVELVCSDCPNRGAKEVDFLRRVFKFNQPATPAP